MGIYNGAPAHTAVIAAGTTLYRVHRTDSQHAPNSFNSTNIAPLVDALRIDLRHDHKPEQGRFDPVHDDSVCPDGSTLGGYIYLGLSVGAVVAEGIRRDTDIPKSQILPAAAISELSLTQMTLQQEVIVAVLDTQAGLTAINQETSLTSCTWREYRDSRVTCTNILVGNPGVQGVRYRCRNGFENRSLLLIERGGAPGLDIDRTGDLGRPGWARDLITQSLFDDYGVVLDVP